MTYNVFSGTLNPTHFTSLLADKQTHDYGIYCASMASRGKKHDESCDISAGGAPLSGCTYGRRIHAVVTRMPPLNMH